MPSITQGTEKWKALRRTKITASDAAVILGVSKYKTPLELWHEKVGGIEQEYSPQMEWGRQNEELARKAFVQETGFNVSPEVLIHPEKQWMMASLDGYEHFSKTIVEIKCLKKEDHEAARHGTIQPQYYAQIQHQIYVAEASFAIYVGYRMGDMYHFYIARDEEFIKNMLEKEWEFYQRIIDFDPPPMDEKDLKEIKDEKWIQKAERLELVKKLKKDLETEEKELMEQLVDGAGNQPCIGNGFILEERVRKGSVQYKSIPELAKVDLNQYRAKDTFFWVLRRCKDELS